jgi:hypothetical protein
VKEKRTKKKTERQLIDVIRTEQNIAQPLNDSSSAKGMGTTGGNYFTSLLLLLLCLVHFLLPF